MDQAAQDMTAQLAKIKATDSDTIMVTTAVEQLTLVLKQAAALGITKKIVTTGGSQNPDQLIEQAGAAANGSMHLTTFAPWYPDKTPDPKATEYFLGEWKKRGFSFAGATESFRGYDGIRTIAHAIQGAGKAEPDAITQALWKTNFTGLNGPIKFQKQGPAGRESGQSMPNLYLIKIEGGKVVLAES
jgi:branched-chain amino acid transport system substrate-binding protein